jgi:hypothetical protein
MQTVRNGQERLGKFEPERSNTFELIVENIYVYVSKAKNPCIETFL